jgi:hypothetical protein
MDRLDTIKWILKRHGIMFETIDGRLIADYQCQTDVDVYHYEKKDLTDYSVADVKTLLDW